MPGEWLAGAVVTGAPVPPKVGLVDVAEINRLRTRDPAKRVFGVELPDKRTLDVEAENIIDAGEGAREWWQEQIEKSQKSIGELLVGSRLVYGQFDLPWPDACHALDRDGAVSQGEESARR